MFSKENVLQEILIPASVEVKAERFKTNSEHAAGCSGSCASGRCQGYISDENWVFA